MVKRENGVKKQKQTKKANQQAKKMAKASKNFFFVLFGATCTG
jgi:hypothetical protein